MNEELKVIISAEIGNLKKNISEAKKEISGFKDQVAKASKNVDADFKKLSEGIKKGGKVMATSVAAVGAAFLALGPATEKYRQSQAQLTSAFEASGGTAREAKEAYNDLYRVLGDNDAATETATHIAKLTTNQKELEQWTTICKGVWATYGESLPIEGLTEAANETAKTGAVTGVLADALNWAGVSEDAFNESLAACNTEAEREQLIRKTLSGLYDDAASKYEKNNSAILAQNEAQAKLNEAMAKLGEAAAPIITMLATLGADVLTAITPYIQSFAENYLPKIQEVLGVVAEKLGEALIFLLEHKTILAVMAGIIGGIAIAIGLYNAVAAVKAAMDAAQVTTLGALIAAQLAQAAAMTVALAPYIAIVAAIAAVIAIIVLCIKHWDEIKAVVIKVTNSIAETVEKGVNAVKGFFEKIINFVKENWQGLLLLIVNPFAGAFKLAYDNCERFRNKVDGFIEKVKSIIQSGFNIIKEKIINPIKEASNSVKDIFNNIVSTISNKMNNARDKVKTVIDKIKGFFNFTWSLPKLKMPHLKITGEFSISPPSVPKFSVDWYARGGVFDKPTLFTSGGRLGGLGEAGAEAIVPLENNTQWLDKIANMLSDKLGGGRNIVLQVDGKTFGQISVDSINALTKQTGNLPLVIV